MSSNEKRNTMNKAAFAMLMGCFTILAACTKEVPYKYEYKEQVNSKSQIDTGSDYLYTASLLETSRNMADGTAFQFGDNKRVRLQWTEKSLKVVEKDRDERYSHDLNNKVILEIPVEHIDYECAKDAYGDCTNSETQKNANWTEKGSFKIKPEEAKQGALELLPILFEEAVGSPCNQEISSEVTGYEITRDAINLQVKRNFRQLCIENIENSLSETNFSAIFHYSLVRTDAVLSKDFKPINYSKIDEDTFGFFASTYKKRDVDNNLVENSEKTVANHWNPNRQKIDFYLSDSFNKPQHKKLKEASYEAVRQMNAGLKISGAQFQIVLHEPAGKNPGDIRNSMIVLVDEPYESAPLGYGPQTEDPVTGEIISARTIMYLAGLQQSVRVNYEDIGRAIQKEKIKAQQAEQIKAEEQDNGGLILEESDGSSQAKFIGLAKAKTLALKKSANLDRKNSVTKASGAVLAKLENEKRSLRTYTSRISDDYSARDKKAYFKYITEAKNCSYKSEGSLGLAEVRPDLEQMIAQRFVDAKTGSLKPWKSLSNAEKQEIMDIVIPEVWVPVLLHELGHNMGLRHNFKGSEDKDNYFTDAELKARGVNHKIPYSTIMEYGDDLRTLPFLGKYDIAALKYAYARKVGVIDAKGSQLDVSLDTNLKDLTDKLAKQGAKLVEYGYCTDEHVGPNPGCRRFDEGVSLTEIAQYLVDSYNDRYELRATRNGLENFSTFDNLRYMQTRTSRFMEMRVFSELYERLKNTYNLTDDNEAFETVDWLKDLKQAVLLTNRLMMKVILTPDLHCAIASAKNPSQIIAVIPLNNIDKGAYDCSTASLNDQYVIVGQAGKSMNDKKHPDNQNNYMDQIDVRGYWMDKWAAAKVLFARNMSPSFNRYFDNAWDIADLRPELKAMISDVIKNQVVVTEKIKLVDGQEMEAPLAVDFFDSQVIQQPMDTRLAKVAGLTSGNVSFSDVLSALAAKESTANMDNLQSGQALKDLVTVKLTNTLDDVTRAGDDVAQLRVGSSKLYASAENEIAHSLIEDAVLQQKLSKIEDATLQKLNMYLQNKSNAKQDIDAQELTTLLPELSADQKSFVVSESIKNSAKFAEKIDILASGSMLSPGNIVKILFGLPKL